DSAHFLDFLTGAPVEPADLSAFPLTLAVRAFGVLDDEVTVLNPTVLPVDLPKIQRKFYLHPPQLLTAEGAHSEILVRALVEHQRLTVGTNSQQTRTGRAAHGRAHPLRAVLGIQGHQFLDIGRSSSPVVEP